MSVEQPFLIRAHHLTQDYNFFKAALESAQSLNNLIIGRGVILMDLAIQHDDEFIHPFDPEYLRDVLGEIPKVYLPAHNRRVYKFYRDFKNLDQTHPVHIINGRDGICRLCVFGEHCAPAIEEEHSEMTDLLGSFDWLDLKEDCDYRLVLQGDKIVKIETTKQIVAALVISTNAYLDSLQRD